MSRKIKYLTENAQANDIVADEPMLDVNAADENEQIDDGVLAEALREDILILEQEIDTVTKKLSLAKAKGLIPQANRCRELLQMLVAEKQKKQAELSEVELRIREADAKRFVAEFSEEIDELSDHVENDILKLNDDLPQPPDPEPVYNHEKKAKRLSLISRIIAFVGIFSGLIGALVYMLLVEYAFFPFKWLDLAIFGGVVVVLLIVAICVGGASNHHRRLAAEHAEELARQQAEYEAEIARIMEERNAIWKNECVDSVLEAYRLEKAGDAARSRKKALQKLIPDLSDPKTLHKVAPIAAACTAVAAITLATVAKKSSQKRKAANFRKTFFDWMT